MPIEDMLVGQDSGHPLDSPMTKQEVLEVLGGFRELVRKDVATMLEQHVERVREVVVAELKKVGLDGGEEDEKWKA